MKRLIPFVLASLLLLTGCKSAVEELHILESSVTEESYRNETQDNPVPMTENNPVETTDALDDILFPLEANVIVVNSHDCFDTPIDDDNRVFRSYDELNDFIENVVAPNYVNGVPAPFYSYDEEFFETGVLCYTTIPSGTGSVKFFTDNVSAVKTYGKDGTCRVDITVPNETPEMCTEDMAYFCIFAELSKDDLSDTADENIYICGKSMSLTEQKEERTFFTLFLDHVAEGNTGISMEGTTSYYLFEKLPDGEYDITVERQNYGNNAADGEILHYCCTEKDWAEIEAIIKKCDVQSWDGFDTVYMSELPMSNFTFRMNLNGESADANGYGAFPDDFHKVVRALDKWLAGLEKK